MNKDYCLTGTKVVIRRLFKQDFEDILSCYEEYKLLYHKPINTGFMENIFLYGEIWGAYLKDNIIGCCYYFPVNSEFFSSSAFCEALKDFISNSEKYFYMGYVGIKHGMMSTCDPECPNRPTESGLYQAFMNIAQMQAFRRGFKYIIHASPVKLRQCSETFFTGGYNLIKIRGLENLVVHYIFAKPVFSEENIYETDTTAPPKKILLEDTKKISALLENGYCGVDYSKNDNTMYLCRLITD